MRYSFVYFKRRYEKDQNYKESTDTEKFIKS